MARLTRARSLLDRMIGFLPERGGRNAPVSLIPRVVHVGGRADLPRLLNPRRLYLVGEPPKWAIFRCPCGTGHQIDLNLVHAGRPRWNVVFDEQNRPSLRPSVNVKAELRCHFWLTAGEVRWCQDSGQRLPALTLPGQRRLPAASSNPCAVPAMLRYSGGWHGAVAQQVRAADS